MRKSLVAALTALLVVAAPAAGIAQTDDTAARVPAGADIDDVKARALEAIDQRLETIDRLRAAVTAHPHVTGEHQGALLGELGRAEAGLQSLAAQIRAAETLEELRVLVPKIATDFRIYLVVVPKVWEVLGSDTVVAVAARLEGAAGSIAEWIARAEEAGLDVTEAAAHLAEMERHIESAVSLGDPVAEEVLPLTAADWPDPAQRVLTAGKKDLQAARQQLKEAWASGKAAVHALRQAFRPAA